MRFIRFVSCILVAFLLALTVSIVFDRFLGVYLHEKLYFKALHPRTVEVYETREFHAKAKISSQGLRNEEVTLPKPPGVYRILALGDSMTFGWGINIEDTWPKLLEKSFGNSPKKVEVINAGVPGFSPDQETQVCKIYKGKFGSDLVILAVYPNDDMVQLIQNKTRKNSFKSAGKQIWPTLSAIFKPIISDFIPINIPPDSSIDLKKNWREEALRIVAKNPDFTQKISLDIRSDFVAGLINPSMIHAAIDNPNYLLEILDGKKYGEGLKYFASSLMEFKKECAGNTPVTVFLIPPQGMVSREYLNYREKEGFNISDKLLSFDPSSDFKKMIEGQGFKFISLFDDFRYDGCPGCYFHYDEHLTPVGTERIANYLGKNLHL